MGCYLSLNLVNGLLFITQLCGPENRSLLLHDISPFPQCLNHRKFPKLNFLNLIRARVSKSRFIRNTSCCCKQTILKMHFIINGNDKGRKENKVSSWNLAEDTSLDIFSRLPVKAVMRCRCVCKSWRVLLSTPYFINMHLHSSSSNSLCRRDIVFVDTRMRDIPKYDLDLVEDFWGRDERVRPLLMPLHMASVFLVGSCNGLLCLTNHSSPYQVYVWNPCTGESTQFPLNPSQYNDIYYSGFGHDPVRDEYKLVTMSDGGVNEVWTLGSDSWRNAGVAPFTPLVSSSVFVAGALHCLATQSIIMGIGSFHVAKEEFEFFPIVMKITDSTVSVSMGVLGGDRIAVACTSHDEIDIWVTEDYKIDESWTRQYVLRSSFIRHIEILKDWELVIDHAEKVFSAESSEDDLALEGVINVTSAYVHIGTLVSPIREQCCRITTNN